MLEKGLVTDSEGNTLTAEDDQVKEFWLLEEVRVALMDEELFHYLYE